MKTPIALFALPLLLTAPAAHATALADMHLDAPQGIGATLIHAETYGAKGDGASDDTKALQAAIDATAAAHGTLVLKPGTYLTGALFLKSHMALRLDKGVTLTGAQDIKAYPRLPSRVAGIEMTWPVALLNIYKQTDVKVYGDGVLDGNGKVFWDSYWKLRHDYEPKGLRWASDYDAERPRLFLVYGARRVEIGNGSLDDALNFTRSGFWTLQVTYSDNVNISGIKVRNNVDGFGPSTDGVDIDSSHDVIVEKADIDNHDDDIVLKSGRDADGLRVNRPTYNVVVRDSIIRAGAAGIAFGSETSGGIHDVEVYNLTVVGPTFNGILLKSAHTRGGTVSNINIHDMKISGVDTAIRVDLNWNPAYSYASIPADVKNPPEIWKILATPVPHDEGLPHYKDIHISHITATDTKVAVLFDAYPDAPAEDFTLDHIDLKTRTAGSITHARGIHFTNTTIDAADGSHVKLDDATDVTGLP
ncbi:glycosyl hydrolase family 28 protein [Asticcacaulis sp. EMRT-3]|uniref:glycoside hydrolase family 28 protein n=1 Tax=Asticcacaulis sp. EMRT-3 TaxID=3040349 RepID=UPI0024AF06EC|nr:glycosyl hydrolase family 28 protein [Asticcacaulis sp. EMRT-3]MDI7776398.1 glycosyl hydrolase family 28 protein [Asticcacaulis sp. EMRT-3]